MEYQNEVIKEGFWDFNEKDSYSQLDISQWSSLNFHNSDIQLHPKIRKKSFNKIELIEHFASGDCETHIHNLQLIKIG